jgi:glycosyltransferase involved in cell wall biosynthesis
VLLVAGPDEGGMVPELRALAERAGAAERVQFLGMVEGEAKLDLLGRADLFCLPSASEGFSIAVLEALASGTAVLLSPGCNFDAVEGAQVGRVVSPAPAPLADAMLELLGDPRRLAEMGRRARRFAVEQYSWERIADQMIDIYAEGIARNQSAS